MIFSGFYAFLLWSNLTSRSTNVRLRIRFDHSGSFFPIPYSGGCKNLFFYSPYFFARRRFFSFAVLFFVCRIVFMYAHGRSQKNNTHRNQNPFELLSFKTLTRSTPAFIIIPLTAAKIKVYGAINFRNIGTANP